MIVQPRFAVWLMVVTALFTVFLITFDRILPHAEQTAYTIAAKRMLSQANIYKAEWVLNDYPQEWSIEGRTVLYNPYGWILPEVDGELNCEFWFELLSTERTVYGQHYQSAEGQKSDAGYTCIYRFPGERQLIVSLKGKVFAVTD